ncbi:hypothetical protein BJ138DRAFT_1163718, partial [Hygrophoropsis aurantiaca]
MADCPDHDPETFLLRAPLGAVDSIQDKSRKGLKFLRRKNPKKDPLEDGIVYLSISLAELNAIRTMSVQLSVETEEDITRLRGGYTDLDVWGKNLKDRRHKRSTIKKLFSSSSLSREIQEFLQAARDLSVETRMTSDSVRRMYSRHTSRALSATTNMVENMEPVQPSDYEKVTNQSLNETDRVGGFTVTLPPNHHIDDEDREFIHDLADMVMQSNLGDNDDADAISDRGSTITPNKYRRNSFSSLSTSFRGPLTSSSTVFPANDDLPTPPSPSPSARSLPTFTSPDDASTGIHNTPTPPLPSPSTRSLPASPLAQHIHHHHHNNYYFGNGHTFVQESQILGTSLNPTFNTKSSRTQGATFSNPTSP